MPTLNKLEYLNETKQQIKGALNTNFNSGITDSDTFRSYVGKISDIYTNWPKSTGTGTYLELTPTKKGKMSIGLKGNSSQDGEPTPDTPYPVKTVTGENSILVQNENLFNHEKRNYYFNNQKQFVNIASAITTGYIPAKEGDIFTIYTEESSTGIVIASFDKDYNCLQRDAIGTTSQSLTHTCPTNTRYIIGSNYIGVSTDTTLIKGDTPLTTYIAHQSQTYPLSFGDMEFCSSPDETVSDEIRGTLDNWFKREYIGKTILDGSEDNWINDNDNAPYRINISGSIITTSNNLPPQIWINNFQKTSYNSTWSLFDSVVTASEKANPTRLKFRYTAVNNLEEFKTWLSTHNSTVYYVRANYQDIPITDTTLISQLNDIYNNAKSYDGTTNITSTYANGNEQMIIDASALMKGGN